MNKTKCRRKKMHFLLSSYLAIAIFLAISPTSFAHEKTNAYDWIFYSPAPVPPSGYEENDTRNVSITQLDKENDYQIKYRATLINKPPKPGWSQHNYVYGYDRGKGSGNYTFGSLRDGWSSREFTINAFPNTSARLGAEFVSKEKFPGSKRYSRWGYKRLKTADLKAPSKLRSYYDKSSEEVIITWQNETNVPNDKYQIKVEKTHNGTTTTTTLNGGTTQYTDGNVTIGQTYKYTVYAYHQGGYSTQIRTAETRTSYKQNQELTIPHILDNLTVDSRSTSMILDWRIKDTERHDRIRVEYYDGGSWNLIEEVSESTDRYTWVPNFAIIPGDTYQLRVRAMDSTIEKQKIQKSGGIPPNGVLSGHVKIVNTNIGVPEISVKVTPIIAEQGNHVQYEYFEFSENPQHNPNSVDELDSATPVSSGTINKFRLGEQNKSSRFGFIFNSYIKIEEAGTYTFYTKSDDGSTLSINDELVVDNDGIHGSEERSGEITLSKGYHKIQVKYTQGPGGKTLKAFYESASISKTEIPSSVLYESVSEGTESYTAITDKEGYFYIDEIYYSESRSFNVIAERDEITPVDIKRTLSLNHNAQQDIRFDDLSSKPVYGQVLIGECPVKDASVVFNDELTEAKTDASGNFKYIIQNPNASLSNNLDISYKNHIFDGQVNVDLSTGVENQDNPYVFHDLQQDTLILSVLSGCALPIADEVDVQLISLNDQGSECRSNTYTINDTGIDTLYLPAGYYKASVVDMRITDSSVDQVQIDQFNTYKENMKTLMGEIDIDLTQRDTVKRTETVLVNEETNEYDVRETVTAINLVKAAFVYRQKIELSIESSIWDEPTCSHEIELDGETKNEDIYLLEQAKEYAAKIKLLEKYDIYPRIKHQCGVDSAGIAITDNLSDREQKTYTIIDGTFNYTIRTGESNINGDWNTEEHAFQKNINIVASVPDYNQDISESKWGLIEGHKIYEPTFVTQSIDFPEYILHDPPGDASYSYIEKGSSFSTTLKFENMLTAGAEASAEALFQIAAFYGVKIGAGFYTKTKAGGGYLDADTKTYTSTLSEKITTNKGSLAPGEDSDVIIGLGVNFVYSKSKELDFDCVNGPSLNESYVLTPGFGTRYYTSVYHIKNHVLPTLDKMLTNITELEVKKEAGEELSDEEEYLILNKEILKTSRGNWSSYISNNKRQIFLGGDILSGEENQLSNITITGGVQVDYSNQLDTIITETKDKHWEVSTSGGIKVKIGDKDAKYNVLEIKAGGYIDYKGKDLTATTDKTFIKQGFHLEDKSIGDFFTVDITKDPIFRSYLFTTISGRSSCPVEPNTQARDRAKLEVISDTELRNLPDGKKATYKVRLLNDSQSEEGRPYSIFSLSGQENGSKAYIGATRVQPVGTKNCIVLPSGENNEYTLAIEKGNGSSSTSLELVMAPECFVSNYKSEDLLKAIKDELLKDEPNVSKVTVFASWESSCDGIQIESPEDNWIVNTTKNKNLQLVVSGFDPNSSDLDNIKVLKKIKGDTIWSNFVTITKENIGEYPRRYINLKVDTIPSGEYALMAQTYCNNSQTYNYSNVINGTIDNNPFVLLETNIINGWLNEHYIIGNFSEEVANAEAYVDVLNDNLEITKQVKITGICQGTSVHFQLPDDIITEDQDYRFTFDAGKITTADGEGLTTDRSYLFKMNAAEANWLVPNKVINIIKGETSEFSADLINKSSLRAKFEIISNSLSAYLTPQKNRGTIPAGGIYPVNFSLDKNADIPVGTYQGEVVAKFTLKGFSYYKTLEIELNVKAMSPSWEAPKTATRQMHVIAQFTTSSTYDTPLSNDEQDYIAAFINGEVAGVSKIYYDPSVSKYLAYITVGSNESGAHKINFKMWDASEGVTYTAKEELDFVNNQVTGSVDDLYVLHSEKAVQKILLQPGWNFISLNVNPNTSSIDEVFSSIRKENVEIKSLHDGICIWDSAQNSWLGTLEEFNSQKAYKIYVEQEDILEVEGELLDEHYALCTDLLGTFHYNWLPVYSKTIRKINKGVNKYPLLAGDVIRYQNNFSVLNGDKNDWNGNITEIAPGRGYELYQPDNNLLDIENAHISFDAVISSPENTSTKLIIAVGGDQTDGYHADATLGVPNALENHSITVTNTTQTFHLQLSSGYMQLYDLMFYWNSLFVENDDTHPNLTVDISNLKMNVYNDDNTLSHSYDISSLLQIHPAVEYSYNSNGGGIKLKKTIIPKEYFDILFDDESYFTDHNTQTVESSVASSSAEEVNLNTKNQSVNLQEQLPTTNFDLPYTMSIISDAVLNGKKVDFSRYQLKIKQDNILVGASNSSVQKQIMLIHSNDENSSSDLKFSLLDSKTGDEFESEQYLSYTIDGIVGSIKDPYTIVFGSEGENTELDPSLKIWPSVTSKNNRVNGNVAITSEKEYRLNVVDLTGRVRLDKGIKSNDFYFDTTNFSAGIYIVTILEDGTPKTSAKLLIHQ